MSFPFSVRCQPFTTPYHILCSVRISTFLKFAFRCIDLPQATSLFNPLPMFSSRKSKFLTRHYLNSFHIFYRSIFLTFFIPQPRLYFAFTSTVSKHTKSPSPLRATCFTSSTLSISAPLSWNVKDVQTSHLLHAADTQEYRFT